ncbi:MAG TPA: molybdenum cofactor biosynthesis protein MoaE [Cellvibrionaceae bacterium]
MISVQTEDFDAAQETALLRRHLGVGALVSFVGLVRDFAQKADDSDALYVEHYPGMTEKSLAELAEQARQRWELSDVRVIHRVGLLTAGEQIVLVATAASHRRNAFAACEWLMDMLKTQAPFWKREGEHWVQAKESDQTALARWHIEGLADS